MISPEREVESMTKLTFRKELIKKKSIGGQIFHIKHSIQIPALAS